MPDIKVRHKADSPMMIALAILIATAVIVFVIVYFDKNDNFDTTRMPNTSYIDTQTSLPGGAQSIRFELRT